jgi:uncharacterized protein
MEDADTVFVSDTGGGMASIILTVIGLAMFETITSIDNAIINAQVLSTMQAWARRWFLLWGLVIAVFLVRGLLPWVIVWVTVPSLGPLGALTSTFSGDPAVAGAIEKSAPILLVGGGTFLVFLFFHWLFLEPKHFGLPGEAFFQRQGGWFFTVVSVLLAVIVWFALRRSPMMAFGAVVGSTAFFITHGFREHAERAEKDLLENRMSDWSKILYLEVIDTTFSIDGVLGAFAFSMSVPLILLGNGLGALVVRQLTVGNVERIKRFQFLKNGAMYSVLLLGGFMVAESFGVHVPVWLSPVTTFGVVGFFFLKSLAALRRKTDSSGAGGVQ